MRYTAGIDHDKVGFDARGDLTKAELLEQFPDLLAFVLIDLAAKGIYGKSFHDVL